MKHLTTLLLLAVTLTTLNAQDKEEPKGKISGVFFMDYFYNVARDTGFADLSNKAITGEKDIHGIQIRRIYLTYDYKFNSKLSSRFRLESDEMNFTTNSTAEKANKFGVFIKDAYVKWNYSGKHYLYAGIQSTPAFEVSESVWGNRYIEKTIMDLRKIVGSRDFGISLRGQFDSTGIFKYWLMYANGSAGSPETDKYKRFYTQFEIYPVKNLSLTLYGDYQSKEAIEDVFNPGETLNNDIFTAAFFIGYKEKNKFSTGIETYYTSAKNAYTLTDSYENLKGIGLSIFGNYYFSDKISAFARFDRFEPNIDSDAKGDTRNLYIGGIAVKPAENFTISPNVFVETFEKVGSTKIESSVNARITLQWVF